ncbi:MAG TPA: cobalt ECF transporter T component CbiQ [Blastocatellia bacterium]
MHLRHTDIDRCVYANRWRNRHACEKLLLAGGMLLLAVALPPFPASLLIAATMTVVSLVVARIPWRTFSRVLVLPTGFAVVSASTVLFSVSTNWQFEILPQAWAQAGGLLARALAAVCCLSFLMLTTPMEEILTLLRRAGLPVVVAELMLAMHRFISIFADTARAMWLSQTARCGYATPKQAWRSVSLLAASLFIHSLDRARRMEIGLAARGYDGEVKLLAPRQTISFAAVCAIIGLEVAIALLAWKGWRS